MQSPNKNQVLGALYIIRGCLHHHIQFTVNFHISYKGVGGPCLIQQNNLDLVLLAGYIKN